MWLRKGKFGVPCCSCCPRDLTPDKRMKMDGWINTQTIINRMRMIPIVIILRMMMKVIINIQFISTVMLLIIIQFISTIMMIIFIVTSVQRWAIWGKKLNITIMTVLINNQHPTFKTISSLIYRCRYIYILLSHSIVVVIIIW